MTRHVATFKPSAGKAQIIDLRQLVALDADPDKQANLRKILIEEEDKLATDREQLERSARLVSEGKARLDRLKRIKSSHKNVNDHGLEQVMALTQLLFENFHRRLLTEYPYAVKLEDRTVGVCTTLDEAQRRAQYFANANPQAIVTVVDAWRKRSETVRSEH